MKQIHVPQQIIPERNEVQIWETDYPDFISFVGREVRLSEKIYNWLNENFSEWSVSFDEGDMGEGVIMTIIYFSNKEDMNKFVEKWNKDE